LDVVFVEHRVEVGIDTGNDGLQGASRVPAPRPKQDETATVHGATSSHHAILAARRV
jgi:hypothetical protein